MWEFGDVCIDKESTPGIWGNVSALPKRNLNSSISFAAKPGKVFTREFILTVHEVGDRDY
jgi:hypothetical protein